MTLAGYALAIAAVTVGVSTAVGYGIYRAVTPKGNAQSPTQMGRKWFAWMALFSSVTLLPKFFRTFAIDPFAVWLIVGIVTCGGIAFGLGWIYGKVTGLKPANVEPPSQESSATIATNLTDAASPEHLRTGLLQTAVDEDSIYSKIAKELESDATDKGLWTRLFAESGGDEKQTKVLYIKQRAERLIAIERTRLAQLESERAANAEQLEQLKRQRDGIAAPELVYAVWNGNWSTASQLLRDGVKPIGRDQDGNTLLDLARKRRDRQMIQLLESYGAPENPPRITPSE
ncbi:MAG: hypothetical protein AMXMBFR6_25820 [Betaproteobacteria bacterium]